jgi:hypothetical protein
MPKEGKRPRARGATLGYAIVLLARSERPSGQAFLAGAVAAWSLSWIGSLLAGAVPAWSLSWIGSLLATAKLRDDALLGGLSLEAGFWLQAVSIVVTVIGTILVGFGNGARSRTATTDTRTQVGVMP